MKQRNIQQTLSILGIVVLLSVSSAASAGGRMSERAKEVLANRPLNMVELIVTYHQAPGPNERANVTNNGGQIRHEFNLIKGHAITVPAQAAKALENNPNVARVSNDEPVGVMATRPAESLPSPILTAFPGLDQSPYTGAGISVAVIDSGMRSHPDKKPSAKEAFGYSKTDDKYGHGNHVAGIIAGTGDHSEGPYRGVAPNADIIALRVLDDYGQGLTSDVIAALDWVVANRAEHNIRIANLVTGAPGCRSRCRRPAGAGCGGRSWDVGVVVVCSAGNAGRDGYGTITSPGNSRKVITVGSVTTWGDTDVSNDMVSTFSSRGPTRIDRFVKPDLITHGNRVISANADKSWLDSKHAENLIQVPGAKYCRILAALRQQHVRRRGQRRRGPDVGKGPEPYPGHHQGTADALGHQGRLLRRVRYRCRHAGYPGGPGGNAHRESGALTPGGPRRGEWPDGIRRDRHPVGSPPVGLGLPLVRRLSLERRWGGRGRLSLE